MKQQLGMRQVCLVLNLTSIMSQYGAGMPELSPDGGSGSSRVAQNFERDVSFALAQSTAYEWGDASLEPLIQLPTLHAKGQDLFSVRRLYEILNLLIL